MKDSTPIGLQSQIDKIRKLACNKQILFSDGPLSGEATCGYIFGIDNSTGNLYYKDDTNQWTLVPTGSGGGGGGSFDSTVDFSVNANPNTPGTTFSPNTPALTTVLYISTIDFSQWTYNGSTYVTYISPFWTTSGNPSVTASNFIGSVNNASLKFRTNNTQRAIITNAGKFGINTNTPSYLFDIQENTTAVFAANVTNNSTTGHGLNVNVFGSTTQTIMDVLAGASGTTSRFKVLANGQVSFNNTPGTSGQFLTSAGTNTPPTWTTLSFANIGASPNAQAASYSAGTITLQPASASFGGIVTTGAQTLGAGDKTFSNKVAIGATAGGLIRGDLSIANFILNRDTSPVSGALRFGDGTGWRFHVGQMLVSGVQQTGDASAYMTFRDSGGGAIGINNINPSEKLDVTGNIRFSGALLPNNLSGTSGQVLTSSGSGVAPTWTTITASPSYSFADEEDVSLSGTMNSINTSFTLSHTPIVGSVKLYLRGKRLKNTVDYTISGTSLTMIDIPDAGDSFVADYRY